MAVEMMLHCFVFGLENRAIPKPAATYWGKVVPAAMLLNHHNLFGRKEEMRRFSWLLLSFAGAVTQNMNGKYSVASGNILFLIECSTFKVYY